MQIESYNPAQLQTFIDSDFYKNLTQIPISYHRAVSHIHNPDVEEDDELLWAAYEAERLVGYVGVLPGFIHVNQERKKIFWLSCFWVDEHFRKSNVASLLFFSLMKRYKTQLFISNFLPNLEKTYQSLGIFKPTIYKTGTRFFCRSCFGDLLPVRFPKIKFLKPLFTLVDFLLNLILSLRKIFHKSLPIHSQIIHDENFDEELQLFLQSFYKDKNYVERHAAHFQWILQNPWVLQGKTDAESKRYFFSSKAEQFEYDFVKFYKNDRLSALALLKTRDRKLSVSYIFAEDEMYEDVTNFILQKIAHEKLRMLTTFDEQIANRIRKHRTRYLFKHNYKRPYIIPKMLEINPEVFQEGDGDNAVT
jgi:hypothetical protein